MSNMEVEAYIIYLCAFVQPQSHQIIQVPTHIETPTPIRLTYHHCVNRHHCHLPHQWIPLPPLCQCIPLPFCVSMDMTLVSFFIFIFTLTTSTSALNPFVALHTQHVHMQCIHTCNTSASTIQLPR